MTPNAFGVKPNDLTEIVNMIKASDEHQELLEEARTVDVLHLPRGLTQWLELESLMDIAGKLHQNASQLQILNHTLKYMK